MTLKLDKSVKKNRANNNSDEPENADVANGGKKPRKDRPKRFKYWNKIVEYTKALGTTPYSLVHITAAAVIPTTAVCVLIANNAQGLFSGLLDGDPIKSNLIVSSAMSLLLATTSLSWFAEAKRSAKRAAQLVSRIEQLSAEMSHIESEFNRQKRENAQIRLALDHILEAVQERKRESTDGWQDVSNEASSWSRLMPDTVYTTVNGGLRFDLEARRNALGDVIFEPNIDRLLVQMRRYMTGTALKEVNHIIVARSGAKSRKPAFSMIAQIAAYKAMKMIAAASGVNLDLSAVRFHICRSAIDCAEAFFIGERNVGGSKGEPMIIRYRTALAGYFPLGFLEREMLTSGRQEIVDHYKQWSSRLMDEANKTLTLEEAEAMCDAFMPELIMPDEISYRDSLREHDNYVCVDDHFRI